MGTLLQDVRYGVRMLVKSPGFTAVAIITLALVIAAITAMFSVVNSVLLRPLPFPEPDRLVAVSGLSDRHDTVSSLSYPDYLDFRERNHTLQDFAVYMSDDLTLLTNGQPLHVKAERVSGGMFDILAVRPQLGRGFRREEDQPGHHVVVLSHAFWRSHFNSDPAIFGQAVTLTGRSYTVVGVMPAGFLFPIRAEANDMWITFSAMSEPDAPGDMPQTAQRGAHYLQSIGRLKPGVTLIQSHEDMDSIARALAKQYPDSNTDREK